MSLSFGVVETLLIYLFVIALSSVFVWLGRNQCSTIKKRLFYGFAVLTPAILAAFRFDVGTDYRSYIQIIDRMGTMSIEGYLISNNQGIEPASYVISVLSSGLFGGPQLYFFCMAAIFILFILMGIRRLAVPYPALVYFCTMLALYPVALNGVRQMAAVAICFFATSVLLKTGNIKKFLLFSLTAMTFHASAIVSLFTLAVYLLYHMRNNKSTIGTRDLLTISTLLAGVVFLCVFVFFGLGDMQIISKYANNLASAEQGNNRYFYLMFVVVFFATVLFYKTKLRKSSHFSSIFLLFMFVELMFLAVGFWSEYIKRFYLYYSVYAYVFYSFTIDLVSKRRLKNLLAVVYLGFSLGLFVLMYFVLGLGDVSEYSFTTASDITEGYYGN